MDRIRLADKIVADLQSGNFDIAIDFSFANPDFQYPIAKGVVTRVTNPNRHFFGYNYDEYDSIDKGSWRVTCAVKHGFWWNQRKWVNIQKFDGKRWIYPKLPQHEMDIIYDAWHNFVPSAIKEDDIIRQALMAQVIDDGVWYP